MLTVLIGIVASAYFLVKHDRDARPTVPEVAYAAARGSTGAAPLPLKGERGLLALTHDGLAFPDWSSLGWVADGRRTDVIGGRTIITVEYAGEGDRRVSYSIVEGRTHVALIDPPTTYSRENKLGPKVEINFISGGPAVVGETEVPSPGSIIAAFKRRGHTIVLTSNRVDQRQARAMLQLANFRAGGRLSY